VQSSVEGHSGTSVNIELSTVIPVIGQAPFEFENTASYTAYVPNSEACTKVSKSIGFPIVVDNGPHSVVREKPSISYSGLYVAVTSLPSSSVVVPPLLVMMILYVRLSISTGLLVRVTIPVF
jgi:hypothetical protein